MVSSSAFSKKANSAQQTELLNLALLTRRTQSNSGSSDESNVSELGTPASSLDHNSDYYSEWSSNSQHESSSSPMVAIGRSGPVQPAGGQVDSPMLYFHHQLNPAANSENRQQQEEEDSGEEDQGRTGGGGQLMPISTRRRLSDGCTRTLHQAFGGSSSIRKGSIHLIGEDNLLPPVAEGQLMACSPTLSSRLGASLRPKEFQKPRNSPRIDDNQLDGSGHNHQLSISTTSLDQSVSPSHGSASSGSGHDRARRSSTLSQCSSVMSEISRNQLHYDLSPDLPLDSSLLDANHLGAACVGPPDDPAGSYTGDYNSNRPASPEPFSLDEDEDDDDDEEERCLEIDLDDEDEDDGDVDETQDFHRLRPLSRFSSSPMEIADDGPQSDCERRRLEIAKVAGWQVTADGADDDAMFMLADNSCLDHTTSESLESIEARQALSRLVSSVDSNCKLYGRDKRRHRK